MFSRVLSCSVMAGRHLLSLRLRSAHRFLVGVVGLDVGDDVMLGVNGHLRSIIELTGFARLHGYPCIGIYRRVVGLV